LTAKNYSQLIELVDLYGSQGFQVLAFPCNQFLGQEPGGAKEIDTCVRLNGGVRENLIMFEKGDVNGKNARQVFTFLKNQLPFKDGSTNVLWNFGKFLVDHEGNPVKRFGSQTDPFKMKDDIELLLAKRNADKEDADTQENLQ
jgi:glutathione peroxidase